MKSFKRFVKPVKIGFASIHPRDQDIDQILKPKPFLAKIGFVSIHKADKSLDKRIRDSIHEELKSEDPEFYQKKLEKHLKSRNIEPFFQDWKNENEGFKYENHTNIDREKIFPNHVDSNQLHNEYKTPAYKSFNVWYSENSKPINHHLIHKHLGTEKAKSLGIKPSDNPTFQEDHISNIAQLTHHPENSLRHDAIVHSGTGRAMHKSLVDTKVGENIHFPAFTSTSTHPGKVKIFIMSNFSRHPDPHRADHTLVEKSVAHFHLPKGYKKARYVANISVIPTEHEVLLHHGQTFKKVGEHREVINKGKDLETHVYHHHFVPVEEE
jgi:hypothetical protein